MVLIVALIGGSIYLDFKRSTSQKARSSYAGANSSRVGQAVIREFPNSIAAGNSYLMNPR